MHFSLYFLLARYFVFHPIYLYVQIHSKSNIQIHSKSNALNHTGSLNFSLDEILDPVHPFFLKNLLQQKFLADRANRMIECMQSHEFQMPEPPLVGYGSHEVIWSCIFKSELARIVWIDGYWEPEAQQNWSRCVSGVSWISEQQIGSWVLLKTDVLFIGEEFNSLQRVDTITDSHAACLNGDLQVFVRLVFWFTCVINLLVVQMRVLFQDTINYRIVLCQRAVKSFLLNEVKSQSLFPFQFADLIEHFFIFFIRPGFQSCKNESHSKIWVFSLDLF